MNAKPKSHQTPLDWRRVEAKMKRQAADDRDRLRRLRQMTNVQFYAYVRRMGQRLDDPYAPVIRKAVRDEFARRGPDPAHRPALDQQSVSAPNPEIVEIESQIAQLRRELEASQLNSGVFA